MSKTTIRILMFVAVFAMITSIGNLIYKMVFNGDVSWAVIIGGLLCGAILAFLLQSYDDDEMPRGRRR